MTSLVVVQTNLDIEHHRLRCFALPFVESDNGFKAKIPQKKYVHIRSAPVPDIARPLAEKPRILRN
jgi:hypothetical protein